MDRLERTIIDLDKSGLVPQSQIETVIRGLSNDQQPAEEGELLDVLHASQLLTDYQLQEAKHGKIRELVLGNYLILERIGQGGMGVVFKARHRQMDRVVAIKVMSPAMLSSDLAKGRFRQEVRNAAKVLHPNIVVAFDAGEANGVQYLAMEYIAGENLAQVVKRNGPFSVERAFSAVTQAALGLEHAHACGMVHRDIKPSNLLLDETGTVKVLDLGLARFAPGVHAVDAADHEALTSEGDVLGTIDYMAPEQAMASSEVDGRADIYSLGATLYFLLTGRPLYPGGNVVEKLLAHRERATPSVREVCPEVPPIVDQMLMTMLAKDPAARFQTMRELAHELERITQQLSVAEYVTPNASATTVRLAPRPTPATTKHRRGTPRFQVILLWSTLSVVAIAGLSYAVGNWISHTSGHHNEDVVAADGHQLPAVSSPGDVVSPTGPVEPSEPRQLDFVMIVDASATMVPTLSRMAGIMPYFEGRLRQSGYDSQFAIVAFGHREEHGPFDDRRIVEGRPRLMHPLTPVGEFSLRLQEIFDPQTAELYPGPIELGSLALREAANDVFGETSVLFRSPGTPIIVLITDEDDDSGEDDFLLARAALTQLNCRFFAFCREEGNDFYGNTAERYGELARERGGQVFSIDTLQSDPRSALDAFAESITASLSDP